MTLNSKTFKIQVSPQGVSRSWRNDAFSRYFKKLWPSCRQCSYGSIFKLWSIMSGMFFHVFSIFQCIFRLVFIPLVVQKQTLGEVGSWMVIWWQVVSGIYYSLQKLLESDDFSWRYNQKCQGCFVRHSVHQLTSAHHSPHEIIQTCPHAQTDCDAFLLTLLLMEHYSFVCIWNYTMWKPNSSISCQPQSIYVQGFKIINLSTWLLYQVESCWQASVMKKNHWCISYRSQIYKETKCNANNSA